MSQTPEFINSARVLIPLAVTFAAPFFIWFKRGDIDKREGMSFVAAAITFLSVMSMVPAVLDGKIWTYTLFTILPGVEVKFCVDGLSCIFAIVASFLWFFATSYNVGYMRGLNEHAQTRYYFCFAVAIFGAVGVAFSANIFTLYLFYEVITVFTYPLVAHHQDEAGYHGARKYLVYLMGTSKLFLLPAMVLTYVQCGTLDFNLANIQQGMFPPGANPMLVTVTYYLFLFGLAKAAIMPLHNWLPSAMVAPTPVSALLHAVAVVKAGVFSVARIILSGFGIDIMSSLGLGLVTAYLAAFTLVVASMIALTKDDLKARLAYSTVSQLSYVIIGIAMLSPMAVQGGLIHIAHHAFSKITLFFAAGGIYVASHLKSIRLMDGLGRRMPWTFAAFSIAALSMIGVPPVCGFVSKWYLANGALSIHQYILLGALLLSTIMNAAYFTPVIYRAFFKPAAPGINLAAFKEPPKTMVIPLFITALISVFLGLFPETFLQFANVFGKF
jgi:multicomponent Na+:H+ antiporter subunit D